jgi:hypothetical protein
MLEKSPEMPGNKEQVKINHRLEAWTVKNAGNVFWPFSQQFQLFYSFVTVNMWCTGIGIATAS